MHDFRLVQAKVLGRCFVHGFRGRRARGFESIPGKAAQRPPQSLQVRGCQATSLRGMYGQHLCGMYSFNFLDDASIVASRRKDVGDRRNLSAREVEPHCSAGWQHDWQVGARLEAAYRFTTATFSLLPFSRILGAKDLHLTVTRACSVSLNLPWAIDHALFRAIEVLATTSAAPPSLLHCPSQRTTEQAH